MVRKKTPLEEIEFASNHLLKALPLWYKIIVNINNTACGDRTRDQLIKSQTLCLTELRRPVLVYVKVLYFSNRTNFRIPITII